MRRPSVTHHFCHVSHRNFQDRRCRLVCVSMKLIYLNSDVITFWVYLHTARTVNRPLQLLFPVEGSIVKYVTFGCGNNSKRRRLSDAEVQRADSHRVQVTDGAECRVSGNWYRRHQLSTLRHHTDKGAGFVDTTRWVPGGCPKRRTWSRCADNTRRGRQRAGHWRVTAAKADVMEKRLSSNWRRDCQSRAWRWRRLSFGWRTSSDGTAVRLCSAVRLGGQCNVDSWNNIAPSLTCYAARSRRSYALSKSIPCLYCKLHRSQKVAEVKGNGNARRNTAVTTAITEIKSVLLVWSLFALLH